MNQEILKEDIKVLYFTNSVISAVVNFVLIHCDLLVMAGERAKHQKVRN